MAGHPSRCSREGHSATSELTAQTGEECRPYFAAFPDEGRAVGFERFLKCQLIGMIGISAMVEPHPGPNPPVPWIFGWVNRLLVVAL